MKTPSEVWGWREWRAVGSILPHSKQADVLEPRDFSSDKATKPQKLTVEKGLTTVRMKNCNSHTVEIITPPVQLNLFTIYFHKN